MTYQPGGLAEKELTLKCLEEPAESVSVEEAIVNFRRWSRWRRRAADIGVCEPDPYLLLKGLNRIIKRPLELNKDLSFRISLARSTLQVDATPTAKSITEFALHLQAELEQVVHLENGRASTSTAYKREPTDREKLKEAEKVKEVRLKRLTEEEWRKQREDGAATGRENVGGEEPKEPLRCNFSHGSKLQEGSPLPIRPLNEGREEAMLWVRRHRPDFA